MRKLPFVLTAIAILLTGCKKATPAPEIVQPTEPAPIFISQKIEPTENYCVSCHTDKEQLISTAKPEEMVESESSGAG
jgi:hypothetical protein